MPLTPVTAVTSASSRKSSSSGSSRSPELTCAYPIKSQEPFLQESLHNSFNFHLKTTNMFKPLSTIPLKKSLLPSIVIIMSMMACILVTVKTTQKSKSVLLVTSGSVEALSFSNELPGPPGERQPQAVWCCGGGWIVREGCCYGASDCWDIGCTSICFSCDGNTWYQ